MLKKVLLTAIVLSSAFMSFSQDSATAEKPTPTITGSVDAYYRFNFHNAKDPGEYNNFTSFTNSHNSFELGMASLKLDHSFKKGGVVLDLGFGRRAEEFSYNDVTTSIDGNGDEVTSPTLLAAIKQAYVTYSPSDKVKFTFGKFGTHVGYELLDPQLNRNYSMSYMFSYGPFFHTGLKMDITASDNVGFMVGIANPTDYSTLSFGPKFALAQFHVASSSGNVGAYVNYVGGKYDGVSSNQFDAVVTGKISDKFGIGYNGTVKTVKSGGVSDSWWGSALYLNYDPCETFGLTLRGEYVDDKDGAAGIGSDYLPMNASGTSIFATTLSGNIKIGGLTLIPEFRLDSGKEMVFVKNSGAMTKSTGSFIFAAVYSF